MTGEMFYRYDECAYFEGRLEVVATEFYVLKHTPCGVWIESRFGSIKRFVLMSARKRYACPTKEEALVSFIARKKRQRGIYQARLEQVEEALAIAIAMLDRPTHAHSSGAIQ